MASFMDPQRAAQLRQQMAQRNQQAQQSGFGFDDFLTKILLPVGLGIATGVTGGVAAAPLGAAAAIGGGLAGGASGMAAGQQIGSGVENLAEGNTAAGALQLAGGLGGAVGGFTPAPRTTLQDQLAAAGRALPNAPNYQLALPALRPRTSARPFSFGTMTNG